jgi:1-acyl-sn-glycerol-3-phosphate acyltransferase
MQKRGKQALSFVSDLKKMEEYQRAFGSYNKRKTSFFRMYFKLFHRLEVIHPEHVPAGAALIAANHSGGFDLDILSLSKFAHPTRRIHALIAQEWHYLNSPWGRYWVGGGIPLWTRSGIRWEYIDPYLDKSGGHYPGLVAIYPEGNSSTFWRRHELGKFFPGVVRIAVKYRVPIIPAAMIGFCKATPILREIERDHTANDILCLPFSFPVKLKIEFGLPFELTDYYGMALTREEEFWVANEVVRPKLAAVLSKHTKVVLPKPDVVMKEPTFPRP